MDMNISTNKINKTKGLLSWMKELVEGGRHDLYGGKGM